jgi:AbiTii
LLNLHICSLMDLAHSIWRHITMLTLAELRDAIADDAQSLASILRKAKILAYQLNNNEFKNWVEWELMGYPQDIDLPGYRILETHIRGSYIVRIWDLAPVSANNREPISPLRLRDGIPQLERFYNENLENNQLIGHPLSTKQLEEINKNLPNRTFFQADKVSPPSALINIIETVRNKLLSFVLELENIYPENEPLRKPTTQQAAQEVEQIVQTYITVNHNGGELNMSTFDQRQQQVQGNQYNAAQDINFGEVKTKVDFVDALNDLRKNVENTQPKNDDESEIAVDIKANIEKAIVESNKESPNKEKVKNFIEKASGYAKNTASFAGMVTIFYKAAEAISKISF